MYLDFSVQIQDIYVGCRSPYLYGDISLNYWLGPILQEYVCFSFVVVGQAR